MKYLFTILLTLSISACNVDENYSSKENVKISEMIVFQGNYDTDGDDVSDISPALNEGRWTVEWKASGVPQSAELRIRNDSGLSSPLYLNYCNRQQGCSEFLLNCTINNIHLLRCEDPAYAGSRAPSVETGSYPVSLSDHLDHIPKVFNLDLTVCHDECDVVTKTIRLN